MTLYTEVVHTVWSHDHDDLTADLCGLINEHYFESELGQSRVPCTHTRAADHISILRRGGREGGREGDRGKRERGRKGGRKGSTAHV